MASYARTLEVLLSAHPGLFVDEADVLSCLFFENGTGFEWEGGELISEFENLEEMLAEHARTRDLRNQRYETQLANEQKRDRETYASLGLDAAQVEERLKAHRMSFDDLFEDVDPDVERAKELRRRKRNIARASAPSEAFFENEDGTVGRYLDRLTLYANILHVPADVKPDWLLAAMKCLPLAYRSRPTPESVKTLERAELRIGQIVAGLVPETVLTPMDPGFVG